MTTIKNPPFSGFFSLNYTYVDDFFQGGNNHSKKANIPKGRINQTAVIR